MQHVTCADGRTCTILGTCTVRVQFRNCAIRIDCLVMDLNAAFDIIIGQDWMMTRTAVIDCAKQRLTFTAGLRRITLAMNDAVPGGKGWVDSITAPRHTHVICAMLADSETHDPPHDILQLLHDYQDVVLDGDTLPGAPPQRSDLPPAIPLKEGAEPVAKSMYRLSQLERKELERQVKEGLALGFIEASSSPWSAPVLFVKKKTGELRMVLDWRALNALTVKNACASTDVQSLLDQIGNKRIFSVCDAMSAYHQIGLHPEDRPKTAFRTPLGHFQYTVLGFGLVNSPAIWTTCILNILRDLIGVDCLVYMDDIIIMSTTRENHPAAVQRVLDKLRHHKIYLKARKCKWALEEVEFLGYHISANGVRASESKTQALKAWPTPTNLATLRSFIGLATYFRKFIQGFSNMMRPLTNLLRKDVLFTWSADCESAFRTVKDALTTAPVLALPKLGDDAPEFEVITDASGFGIGACLMQDGHPIAFESRTMSPAERNYCTGEQELLAVVHACKVWRPYLECGRQVTVTTDHRPNTFLATQTLMSRRKARWIEFLSRFVIQWQYKPGRTNVADPLSRQPNLLPVQGSDGDSDNAPHMTPAQHPLMEDIIAAYDADPWFAVYNNVARLQKRAGLYVTEHGQVCVPNDQELRERIIAESHNPAYRGHPGIRKTTKNVQRDHAWPGLTTDVERYVACCPSCQCNKPTSQRPGGLLQPLPLPDYPWQSVALDFIVQLPKDKHGYNAILTFTDRLTKMVHFVKCKTTINAEHTAQLFLENVFRLHGLPETLISDRGSIFVSRFWKEIWRALGMNLTYSTAYHPQTDGQSERTNRTLEQYLRQYVSRNQGDWSMHLTAAEFAINNAYQESVKNSPFMLNYGRNPRTPMSTPWDFKTPVAKAWKTQMQHSLKYARVDLDAAQQRSKAYADKHRREVSFVPGDRVLLNTKNLSLKVPPNGTRKLLPRYAGPFEVMERIGAVAYRIRLPDSMARVHNVFHVSLLKLYRFDGNLQPPPLQIELEGEVLDVFERILDHRPKGPARRNTEYLVKWEGYGHEHNTWEPVSSFDHCTAQIDGYWNSLAVMQQ